MQDIFLISTKKKGEMLKDLIIIGSSWGLQGNKEQASDKKKLFPPSFY